MKVLYLTKYFPPSRGGIEILSKNICDFFHKKKVKVEVCSFSQNKTYVSNSNKYKINFFKTNFEFFSTPISLKMMKFIFKNSKNFDYVHIHTPNPWSTICLLFSRYNNLIISWGSDIITQKYLKFFFSYFENKLLIRSKKIICLSKNYLSYSSDLKRHKKKIEIIPPLINYKKFLKRKKFKNRNIQLISIGRLVGYKNFETAIRAFKYLPNNYNLKIIGSGQLRENLIHLVNELKLNQRIKILSNVNEKKKILLLKNSDIFLMCSNSRAESFGIAILEAISLGLPLIISNVKGSGMNDMIINNYNGYHFKTNSYHDCANKILKITSNKKKT